MYYELRYINAEDKKEQALVDAVSMLDALGIVAEFSKETLSVKLSQIRETYPDASENMGWYKIVLQDIYRDPDTGKEKKLRYGLAIMAQSMDDAPVVARQIRDEGYDMKLISVSEIAFDKIILADGANGEYKCYYKQVTQQGS